MVSVKALSLEVPGMQVAGAGDRVTPTPLPPVPGVPHSGGLALRTRPVCLLLQTALQGWGMPPPVAAPSVSEMCKAIKKGYRSHSGS